MKNFAKILIIALLSTGFALSANADNAITKKDLLANIEIARKPIFEKEQDSNISNFEQQPEVINNAEKNWAIKLGSFSNYAKAKNYAKSIQTLNAKETMDKTIEIDVEKVDAALVYNSKLVGFTEEDANNFCNNLKKENKSCMLVRYEQFYLAFKK